MGITVQNRNFEFLYQNKYAIELFNSEKNHTCYHRFAKYEEYGSDMCKDCPLQFTTLDNREHKILRRMVNVKTGEEVYMQIIHQPILDNSNTFDHFIEIITELSRPTVKKLLTLQNFTNIHSDMHFAISIFGDVGGEILTKSTFEKFQTEVDIDSFILKLSQFWFIAIGQGDHWPIGLFGPLPVFDHMEYDSYAFSFRMRNPEMKDQRFAGKDAGVLLIVVRKENKDFASRRVEISATIKEYLDQFDSTKTLSDFDFQFLKDMIIQKQENNEDFKYGQLQLVD